MWGMIWLPWLWCLGYFATPKQGVTKGERARWRFPGCFCWVLSLGRSLFGCWRWAHPLESEVEFPAAKRKTFEMCHVFLLGLRSATGLAASQWQLLIQPLPLKWNCHWSKELRLQLCSLPSRASEKMGKASDETWWNYSFHFIHVWFPCLISNGSPDPVHCGITGRCSYSICHGCPNPEHQVQRCQGVDTSQDATCFFNVSTFLLYLLYPSQIQDYFTDVFSKQTPYIRDYPVARVKANSSEAEPQWQKLAT